VSVTVVCHGVSPTVMYRQIHYSQRHTIANHYDRRITPPSDTDISLQSETYHDMSDRYITVRDIP
jgi:hypothetical protein